MKHLILTLAILFACYAGSAQTMQTIETMAAKHQACLDEGTHMLQCARNYSMQMDSMLNVVYKKLRSNMNATEKEALKKEQLAWLRKRDRYFAVQQKEYQKNFDSGEWGPDMFMVVYDNNAEFVKDRVLVLINKLETFSSR